MGIFRMLIFEPHGRGPVPPTGSDVSHGVRCLSVDCRKLLFFGTTIQNYLRYNYSMKNNITTHSQHAVEKKVNIEGVLAIEGNRDISLQKR